MSDADRLRVMIAHAKTLTDNAVVSDNWQMVSMGLAVERMLKARLDVMMMEENTAKEGETDAPAL